jgi:SPP1 family predicted phage head-tail adaptor
MRTKSKALINAGKYNRKITIYRVIKTKDAQGFPIETRQTVLTPWANVITTKGMTIIVNNSDFEKAYTNFTIRYPKAPITREMLIEFNGKTYTIEYLNNVNEANTELEIQAKEVTH